MSRIGKRPVVLPAGVKVEAANGVLTVTGKKGRLSRPIPGKVAVEVKDGTATVVLLDKDAGNLYGMSRTLLANMVTAAIEKYHPTVSVVKLELKVKDPKALIRLRIAFSAQMAAQDMRVRMDAGLGGGQAALPG